MIVIPEGSALHVDVFAPTRAIGFVKPGQEVRLLYDAFPYQRFGSFQGKVTRVSRTVLDPRELSVPLKIEEAVYRIEVAPSRQSNRRVRRAPAAPARNDAKRQPDPRPPQLCRLVAAAAERGDAEEWIKMISAWTSSMRERCPFHQGAKEGCNMLRELSNAEQMLVSGGQTSDEIVIRDLLLDSGNIISSDDNSARTSNGTYFLDQDRNGWYDHAERQISGWESDVYNTSTREWFRVEDIEAKELYENVSPQG